MVMSRKVKMTAVLKPSDGQSSPQCFLVALRYNLSSIVVGGTRSFFCLIFYLRYEIIFLPDFLLAVRDHFSA